MVTELAADDLSWYTYPPEADTYRAQYDIDRTAPTMAVVEAVAAIRDVSVEALRPIYDSIDTDALDRIVKDANGDPVEVSFCFEGYAITVSSDGLIELTHATSGI